MGITNANEVENAGASDFLFTQWDNKAATQITTEFSTTLNKG